MSSLNAHTEQLDCVFCDSVEPADVRLEMVNGITTRRVQCLKCEAVSFPQMAVK
jgi:hypothetical protein